MADHTVVCILEARPGQEEKLKNALQKVVTPSRSESTCLEYRLHQCKDNPAKFILYENWTSAADHEKQFEKPYILNLIKQCENILNGPYDVFFAKELITPPAHAA